MLINALNLTFIGQQDSLALQRKARVCIWDSSRLSSLQGSTPHSTREVGKGELSISVQLAAVFLKGLGGLKGERKVRFRRRVEDGASLSAMTETA